MVQILFIDTSVILDFLENRNAEVKGIVEQLLDLHKNGRVILATSVFNIAEAIDKEFDIHFGRWGLNQRMSFDEISKARRNRRKFTKFSERNKGRVQKKIEGFALENEIILFSVPPEAQQCEQLYDLICRYQLQSQDAFIVAAALSNKATYFLSNDSELIFNTRDILDGYNLHDEKLRNAFRSDVLEAI